jgi:hypothetical protein
VGVDVNVDLDDTVEVDGTEAIRRRRLARRPRPTSPVTRRSAQRRSRFNVDDGLNVVRRRQTQRPGSTIRSTSTITTRTCDESPDDGVDVYVAI